MSTNWKIGFAVAVVVWTAASSLWDSREKNRRAIASEMAAVRDLYSAREVVDFVFEAKRSAGVLYVLYGFLIGAAFASMYIS